MPEGSFGYFFKNVHFAYEEGPKILKESRSVPLPGRVCVSGRRIRMRKSTIAGIISAKNGRITEKITIGGALSQVKTNLLGHMWYWSYNSYLLREQWKENARIKANRCNRSGNGGSSC